MADREKTLSGAARLIFLSLIYLVAGAFLASGQDLGSSNKLFGGAKKKAAPTKAARKAPAKARPAASKPKTTAKKAGSSSKSASAASKAAAKTGTSASAKARKAAEPVKKVDISPTKKVDPPVVVNAATEALFEDLIEEGNLARDERNYAGAEAAYKRARPIKPKDSRAVYGLGNLYSDQQRWDEAEQAYRAALEIEPLFSTTHVALSYVLTQPVAAPDLSDRYEEAETLARRAIQLAPSNALAFDQLGVALELRGIIGAETENAYRTAMRLDASFAPAHAHLGRLLRRRGMIKESADAYKDAIKRSNDVATMVLVADVMQSEQRFAESEDLLRDALRDDPKNPSALLLLGRSLTAQGKFAEAEGVLKTSLSISTNGFNANSLLGSLYVRQGKLELAENALLQAVRFVSPLEKRLLSQQFEAVGDGYLKTGRKPNAARAYRQALDLDAERESLVGKLSKVRFG